MPESGGRANPHDPARDALQPHPADGPARRRPRRLWRTGLLLALLFSLACAIAGGCAITCRPTWYAPQAVDYARLPEDKRTIVAIADGIGGALQAPRAFTVDITADQVNRWIVARKELSPEEWLDAEIPTLEGDHIPHLSFLPGGRVRLAALVDAGGFGSIVAVVLRFEVSPGEVSIHIDEVRLGYLPVPRSWAIDAVRRFASPATANQLDADGAVRLANDFVWPNGKRRFRISALSTSDNRLTLTLDAPARLP